MEQFKKSKELTRQQVITDAGNTENYDTGTWRTFKPVWDKDKCKHCLFCWIYCPDSAILVLDGKMIGIKYKHCKGCGICALECPDKWKAITMVDEREQI